MNDPRGQLPTSSPLSAEQLLELVGDYCCGVLDAERGRRLDAALLEDPQARRLFTHYMGMHACLLAEEGSLAGQHEQEVAAAAETALLAEPLRTSGSLSQRFLADSTASPRSRWGAVWALAAALAGVAAFSSWATHRWGADRPLAADLAAPNAAVVARITGTRNCVWRKPELGVGYGSQLIAGQRLELDEGLAEISFESGATLLLEGPATFDVSTADSAALKAGRLAAVVPQQARNFHIHTAAFNVTDASAEYGVEAQDGGASELHVFNGDVQAEVLDRAGHRLRHLALGPAQAEIGRAHV